MKSKEVPFNSLVGKTILAVVFDDLNASVKFHCAGGETYIQYHVQDCCEGVAVEDVCGDLSDILNSPILLAEEVTSNENPPEVKRLPQYQDSFTWTFYKLSTIKGSVTIRWYGESNGCYSESVTFAKQE